MASLFLLVDTVGFLHDLPHELVRAFHSTLEDIQLATCVLHVVDASKPNYLDDIEATETTLEAIDAASIDRLVVFNQCDKTEIVHPAVHASQVYISALDPGDIDFLAGQVNERLFGEWVERETKIPYSDFSRYDTLRQTARILKTEEQEDGVLVRYQIRHRLEKTYKKDEPFYKGPSLFISSALGLARKFPSNPNEKQLPKKHRKENPSAKQNSRSRNKQGTSGYFFLPAFAWRLILLRVLARPRFHPAVKAKRFALPLFVVHRPAGLSSGKYFSSSSSSTTWLNSVMHGFF